MRSVSTNKTSDNLAKTASPPAREASASFTEKRIEFSNHLPDASLRMLTLNTGGRPLRKTWLSRGSQAMKPHTNFVVSPPPPWRDSFNPWEKIRASSFTMSTASAAGPFSRMCASPWGKITMSPASRPMRSPSSRRAEACPSVSK